MGSVVCGGEDTGAISVVGVPSNDVSVTPGDSIIATFPGRGVFVGIYADEGKEDSASEGGGL